MNGGAPGIVNVVKIPDKNEKIFHVFDQSVFNHKHGYRWSEKLVIVLSINLEAVAVND